MAFGTELQGCSSHEALLALQDAEIRLLETVKKCVTQRIKCDRDYAMALSMVVCSVQKQDNYFTGTPLTQVWSTLIGETESFVQILRDNADRLCTSTLECLIRLISEKKTIRKAYADERARLDQELARFQNEVNRLQSDYERRVNKVNQHKNKYNDICKRAKPDKKTEELRLKYVRAESKLHNLHNDYIIAINEVNLYQKHYARIMVPSLLELQQKKQESIVQQCKDMLLEYSNLTDCTTDAFRKVHENIHAAVESINPAAEYKDFLVKQRSEPVSYMDVSFRPDLLGNHTTTLQPGEIALNDLTFETVRQKQKHFSDDQDRSRQHVESKQSDLQSIEKEINGVAVSMLTSPMALTRQIAFEKVKYEMLEQSCLEEKYGALASLLGEPLKMLGTDLPPLALPDVADAVESDSSSAHKGPSTALASFQYGLDQLKTIARRVHPRAKPTIIPPASDDVESVSLNGRVDNGNSVRQVSEASSGKKSSNVVADGACESLVPVTDGYQQIDFKPDDASQLPLHPGRALDDEEWFHGVLPREEVQRLLVEDGDYLVRSSKNRKTNDTQYVLSVMWSSHKHFIIQECEGGWRFEGEAFPTVQELIIHQHHSRQPVTRKSEAILKRPILRADWELKNDDIELHQKIGSGQFGEVFRGTFKVTGAEVAVKTCRETLNDEVKKKFLQEGRILKQYDHPNIVRFIGIAAQRHPVMIVMEYVAGGSLLAFLRKHGQKQPLKTIIKMGEDAAAGMAYLESKNCLHRDLAARNCLVDANSSVKISDFGMSREEQEYVVSGGLKQIPIKWTAPEALNYGTYTSACDIWSYGILLWEIFSFGNQPYPGLTNAQAREKVDEGYRMPPPENTPDEVYQLMMRCWDQDPKNRPRFAEIHRELTNIREKVR